MAELGGSPVADFSKIGQVGQFYAEKASQRSATAHQNLTNAYEQSQQALQGAKQQMLMLPPEAAAIMAGQVEEALQERSKAIMGGSATITGRSTQGFQDLAMSAAKIGSVNKDLVTKYERLRQSDDYLANKEAYDSWYEASQMTIATSAMGGLDGAAQLDFFQPPLLQPDTDILKYGANLFQNEFSPGQYADRYAGAKGSGIRFNEKKAQTDAKSFVESQYTRGYVGGENDMALDIDYQSVQRLHKGAKPAEVTELIKTYKQIEDELSTRGLTSAADIEALEGVPASEKRRLKGGLDYINSRQGVMSDVEEGLVNSVRIDEVFTPASTGGGSGPKVGDFGMNKGTYGSIQSIQPDTINAAGLDANAPIGYVSTKGGNLDKYGSGSAMRYYEGLIYDGNNFKVLAYKPTPDFLQQLQTNSLTPEQIQNAIFDDSKFSQVLEDPRKLSGDIPSSEWALMQQIAQAKYQEALGGGGAQQQQAPQAGPRVAQSSLDPQTRAALQALASGL